jgi:cytochrome c-type biogenesis protein CcmH
MAACAVVAAVWPLFRASAAVNADPAANETAFYKAQLEEIRRDLERGLPPLGEAESARAEAARRLIAAASGPSPAPPPSRRARLGATALIAVGANGLLGQPPAWAAGRGRDRGGGRRGRGAAHRQA